ncbi:NUDIX hydrolase [Nocardia terpenica]|nr:NUDIX hydrolase [Nocardia terpenica]
MSPADRANSRRRQPRRRGSAGNATDTSGNSRGGGGGRSGAVHDHSGTADGKVAGVKGANAKNPAKGGNGGAKNNKNRPRMRTVRETSAGGLVVDGLDGPREKQCAALIGRTDRRGRLLWSLPKGHIEEGETAEQTAVREVAEEAGINGTVVAELGSIDYWFVTDGRRVHKTVHHYLMRALGGELSDADVEVTKVAWVPLDELDSRLAYADERRLAEVANRLIDRMENGRQ